MLNQKNTSSTQNTINIFNISGLQVGQSDDPVGLTGVTVLRFDEGATCGVDVRGAAPGTRETDLLKPENLIDKVHAIVLAGGSVFGLDAMSGVTKYLAEQKIGCDVGIAKIPIVTGAVLFDLALGRVDAKPDAKMGYTAAQIANQHTIREGNAGAGMGASVAKSAGMNSAIKSGLGTYAMRSDCGLIVAAIIAVNAWGDIVNGGQLIASTRASDGVTMTPGTRSILSKEASQAYIAQNTTIGAIITNANVNKSQALKIAQMGHDGYARAINPVHTLFDGDTLFCAGTNEIVFDDMNTLGIMASEVVQKAIYRAITQASSAGGLPTAAECTIL